MQTIYNLMTERLSDKGVIPIEVPRLIRDVQYIINSKSTLTLNSINKRLTDLGWHEQVLDAYILELIVYLLETEGKGRFRG